MGQRGNEAHGGTGRRPRAGNEWPGHTGAVRSGGSGGWAHLSHRGSDGAQWTSANCSPDGEAGPAAGVDRWQSASATRVRGSPRTCADTACDRPDLCHGTACGCFSFPRDGRAFREDLCCLVGAARFANVSSWKGHAMERLLQDIRFGIRSLIKSRHFTIAAVLTLALGIGANSAMFSVIHSVLLKTWPVRDSRRLMVVAQHQANGNSNLFSTQAFLNWKQQGGLLAQMGAHVSWEFNLSGSGAQSERLAGGQVSYDWFPTLGVEPLLGRLFSPQEDIAGAGNFVLLSTALWKNRYGGDPGIVGKPIQLDGAPYTVVGVMPSGFRGFIGKELLWTPLQLRPQGGVNSSPTIHWLSGYIRLPNGVSLAQARSELDSVAARLHRQDPSGDLGFGVQLQTLDDAFTGDVRPALLMLMGCVGFVLLIACANVANLLLARGAARQREMAVRAALGASASRIMRQLLTESVLLAGTGGAGGIAVAFLLLRGMLAIHPPSVPRIEQTRIDGTVLVFSLLVSVAVGILFGLAPAINAARTDANDSLREYGASSGRSMSRNRSVLVIMETALACMLLIGTGLALKSLWSLKSVKLGFAPEQVLTFRVAGPSQLSGPRI